MRTLSFVFVLLMSAFVLAACGDADVAGDPSDTVIDYLEAKIAADEDALSGLLCADMEADLAREANSFTGVADARLEGATCTFDEDSNIVTCEGAIVANYGQEDTEFPLTSYNVVQDDGEWKWCGVAG